MGDNLNNQRGMISVSIILISLIIFVILTSLAYSITNSIEAVISSNDNYRANYISESILELKIMEIMSLSDEVIMKYLLDLQKYKLNYIKDIENDLIIEYEPPNFSTYIQKNFIPKIKKLGNSKSNPFEEYDNDHYYEIEIVYDSNEKVINITSMGRYNRARRFIKAKLDIPKAVDYGIDEYNLPKVNILPVDIVEYYRTIGL